MKKTLTILFLLMLMFFTQMGYYFVCLYQQLQLRAEVKEQLMRTVPENELQIIIQEANNILWEEEGHEFILNGKMFDVVRIEKRNGKTYLYCLNDKKEKQLLDHLTQLIKQNGRKNRAAKQVIKYQVSEFETLRTETVPCNFYLLTEHHINFASALRSSVREILTPPPRSFAS